MESISKKSPAVMLATLRQNNPKRSFAVSDNGGAIGVWIEKGGPYRTVCALGIDGEWYATRGGICANGNPVFTYDKAEALARASTLNYPPATIERGTERLIGDIYRAMEGGAS